MAEQAKTEMDQTLGEAHIQIVSVFGGHKLHTKVWKPEVGPEKAMLFICHGVGEHMGRYEELGSYLAENGVIVFGHDHVGHGHSEGERVHVDNSNAYAQDVICHVEQMKKAYPHLPCILMGHSMGGLVAGLVAIQTGSLFTALILNGAIAEVDAQTSRWFIKMMFRVLSVVLPQIGVKYLDPNDMSSIPEEVKRQVDDPLMWHGSLKARWSVSMISAIESFRENVGTITLPLLLMHGAEDKIVAAASAHFINDNVGSQDKRFELFEGNFHDTLHDKDQERVREIIKDWILTHLTKPQQPKPVPQQSEPEAQQPEPEPQQPEPELQQPELEPQQPEPEPQQPETEPQQPEPELQQPKPEPQQPEPEPQQPDPQQPEPEPQQPEPKPQQPESEPQQPEPEPQQPEPEPQQPEPEPQQLEPEPQQQ